MTKLSVNINKVALVRNSRGGNYPDLVQFALDCERFGAEGITVHPRPDQRHIRYTDIPALKANIQTELNIEGYPSADFMKLVLDNRPAQCTLVPDPPGVLTSDSGWNTIENHSFLQEIVAELKHNGVRTSLFLDPDMRMVEGAAKVNADRVEFYTGKYAHDYASGPSEAIKDHLSAAKLAGEYHLGINAGHDLNLNNLNYFANNIPSLLEVSIGHAIICDSMYYGIQNVIQMYLNLLKGVK